VTKILPAEGSRGPRCTLAGEGRREFLKMNSNAYLGLGLHPGLIRAGEEAALAFGTGPGAVRFISGTCLPHVELEKRLAEFHGRESAMLFNAAYAAVMGVLPPLITGETVVLSDELNHNCIINALRLSRPAAKAVYPHLDMGGLDSALRLHEGKARRAVVVTDGVFSMRGDHVPLDVLAEICRRHESRYEEGILTVVDDSHGIGAFGPTGRGTEEVTGARADLLVATLGKSLGVNGGYAAASETVVAYLRETAPFYVYSNPLTPAEASAAAEALAILDSAEGAGRLGILRRLTVRLEDGLHELGYETIPGPHPIVPVMVRDTEKTGRMETHLFDRGILATGLKYPVVPRGDEELRLQVSAAHTEEDIDFVLTALGEFREEM